MEPTKENQEKYLSTRILVLSLELHLRVTWGDFKLSDNQVRSYTN